MRLLLTAALLFSFAAAAQKKEKPKDTGQFDDLFGAPAKPNNKIDEMKKATEGMGNKTKSDGLAPKVGAIDNEAGVDFLGVFAAEHIVTDKKLGCQPGGKNKRKVSTWTFNELPAKASSTFEVCLTLKSKAGREMNMSVAVVDARGSRAVKGEDVIDFRGRADKIDHVLEFPAPTFKIPGQYFYVVDLDGKEAARLPLFTVLVEGETSGSNGTTPSDLPPKADNTPPSAPKPKTGEDDPLKAATQRDP